MSPKDAPLVDCIALYPLPQALGVTLSPKIDPSNCNPVLVVNALVLDAYTTPLFVNDVKPVPPLVVGNAVPDSVIAKVPLVVIGLPDIDKNEGTEAATLVTVPEPLLLNVVQSAALNAPRLTADAVGTFNVMTGVVVPLATVELKSVPVVPSVRAATLVTVPPVPLIVMAPDPLVIVTPVPAVNVALVSVLPVELPISS